MTERSRSVVHRHDEQRMGRDRRDGRRRGLCSLAAVLAVLLFAGAGDAQLLTFDGQTPGGFSSITEGAYEVTAISGSVDPGGPLCSMYPCAAGSGYFVGAIDGTLQLARSDAQPFDVISLQVSTAFSVGSVVITGTPAVGAPVSAVFPSNFGIFDQVTLPATFDDLVLLTVALDSGLPISIDDVDVSARGGPPGSGTPGTLTLLADGREIHAFGERCYDDGQGSYYCDPYENEIRTPSVPFASFFDSVSAGDGGYAGQDSTASSAMLAGSGNATGWSDIGYGYGRSRYDVTFSVGDGAQIQLEGMLDAYDTIGWGYGEARIELSQVSGPVLYSVVADPYTSPVDFGHQALLAPGDYRLVAYADGDPFMDSSFAFELTAVPVDVVPGLGPLAGAVLALGLGLSGLRYGRRPGLRR